MLERLMDEVDDDEMDKFDPMVDVWRKCIGKGKKIWWEDMFNDDVHGREVEEIPEEDPSPREASMAEENADSPPRQASPASFPGVAEVIESVELLRKELSDGLKDIRDKLDAQDKRIIAVEAFVKNAQSIPDMDDEWRGNDVGYDFSFDRAGKDQGADTVCKGADTVGKGADTASKGAEEEAGSVAKEAEEEAGSVAKEAEEEETEIVGKEAEAGKGAEEEAWSVAKEAEEEAEIVGKEVEAGKGAEASNKEAEPSVMED